MDSIFFLFISLLFCLKVFIGSIIIHDLFTLPRIKVSFHSIFYLGSECSSHKRTEEGNLINQAKSSCGNTLIFQAKFILPSFALQLISKRTVLGIANKPLHYYMVSQTCCRFSSFVTELTQIIRKSPRKDCKFCYCEISND